MAKLIIHCGAHKTATTSLQRLLGRSHGVLKDAGVNYIRPETFNKAGLVPALHMEERSGTEAAACRHVFEKALRRDLRSRYQDDPERVLVSHESLLSYVELSPRDRRRFYPRLENAAGKLREYGVLDLFEEVELVFYVRRQDRFLESVYLEDLRTGVWNHFETIIRAPAVSFMGWTDVADRLRAAFGGAELHVRPFEQLTVDGEKAFVSEFFTLTIGRYDEEIGTLPKANESFSRTARSLAAKTFPRLGRRGRFIMGHVLTRLFPCDQYGRSEVFCAATRTGILESHRQDNEWLFDRYMPTFNHVRSQYGLDISRLDKNTRIA